MAITGPVWTVAVTFKYGEDEMVRVLFEYDEESRKWEVYVNGTETVLEARQAFSAVVITCQKLNPDLLDRAQVQSTVECDYAYLIVPAVEVPQ